MLEFISSNGQLLANIFSAMSTVLLLASIMMRQKTKMLRVQIADVGCCCMSSLLVRSYSALTTNILGLVRNIVNSRENLKHKIVINYTICVLVVVLGLLCNQRGAVGLIPIVASLEYTLFVHKCKTGYVLKLGLAINLALWATHDICVGIYTGFILDCVMCGVSLFHYFREKNLTKQEEKEEVAVE